MKINLSTKRCLPPSWRAHLSGRIPYRYLFIMKLTSIVLTLACLQVSASALSQQITASFSKVPLEKVLVEISKQSDYNFIYDSEYVRKAAPVTLELDGLELKDALELIFSVQP